MREQFIDRVTLCWYYTDDPRDTVILWGYRLLYGLGVLVLTAFVTYVFVCLWETGCPAAYVNGKLDTERIIGGIYTGLVYSSPFYIAYRYTQPVRLILYKRKKRRQLLEAYRR